MSLESILLSIVFIPVAGAFLLPLVGRISLAARNFLALAFVLSSFIFSLVLIPVVMAGGTV